MKLSIKNIIFSIISIIALIFIDQFTKYLAVINLKDRSPFVIIKDVFELHYLENTGAAFGILSGQKISLVIVTAIIIILLALLYFKLPTDKRYTPLRIIEIFLFAGAIGNMIDRVLYNYVIDFFYFKYFVHLCTSNLFNFLQTSLSKIFRIKTIERIIKLIAQAEA